MKFLYSFASAAALLLATSSTATAQVTTFFGDNNYVPPQTRDLTVPNAARTSFVGSLFLVGTDNFESYTAFVPPPATLTFAGVPTTYSTSASLVGVDGSSFGNFSVSPTKFLSSQLIFDGGGNPIGASTTNDFIFSQPVNGFGSYFVNVADDASFTNSFTVTLRNGAGGTPRVYPINATGDGTGSPLVFNGGRQFDSTFYFGIRDTVPFDRITITGTSGTSGFDGYIFDDLSIGFISAIPEPSTYALIAGVGLVVAGRQWMKKRKARFAASR